MIGFFWTSGHLGWALFAVLAFSGIWLLLIDLVWRLTSIAIRRLVAVACGGWLVGLGLVVLAYWASRS